MYVADPAPRPLPDGDPCSLGRLMLIVLPVAAIVGYGVGDLLGRLLLRRRG